MKKFVWIPFLFVLLSASCGRSRDVEYDYRYSVPGVFNDGIETASLESVGMEPDPVRAMMDYINGTELHRIHDILIMRNGKLVFEEYFRGNELILGTQGFQDGPMMQYNRETDHYLASVSKSVTSVIVGTAVKNGLLDDLDKKVIDCFPEYADILTGAKQDITIYHLLTMTSGLAFDEVTYPYGDSRNDITRMFTEADPIRFVLAKPLTSAPGERFFYNSGTVNVLAAIVAKAAGIGFLDYGNEHLFNPLNTEGGVWIGLPGGNIFASGGLYLRARELAKIGQMFLDGGVWQEEQVLSQDWIDQSQQGHIATSGFSFAYSYGYLWWIRNFTGRNATVRCFFAAGYGDQYMFIIPDLDMLIVFNCGNYLTNTRISPFDLVEDYILDAVN